MTAIVRSVRQQFPDAHLKIGFAVYRDFGYGALQLEVGCAITCCHVEGCRHGLACMCLQSHCLQAGVDVAARHDPSEGRRALPMDFATRIGGTVPLLPCPLLS